MDFGYLYEGLDPGTLGQRVVVRGGFRFPSFGYFPVRPYVYPYGYPYGGYGGYPYGYGYPAPAPITYTPPRARQTCVTVTYNGEAPIRRCLPVQPTQADVDALVAEVRSRL